MVLKALCVDWKRSFNRFLYRVQSLASKQQEILFNAKVKYIWDDGVHAMEIVDHQS